MARPAKKTSEGGSEFDTDVDAAKGKLEAALKERETPFDDVAALNGLLPKLEERIKSRRLSFGAAEDDEDDRFSVAVIHVGTDEELGFIFAEDGEYIFESNLEDYFDDFVDEDAESFVNRLYETLRADLAKYEVENKG
jgi:hypothetical protein